MTRVDRYSPEDAVAVAALLQVISELPSVTAATFVSFAAQSFNHGGRDFRVVRDGRGGLVALLTSTLLEGASGLRHIRIAVHPEHRRQGIGTELLELAAAQTPVAARLQGTVQGSWRAAAGFLQHHRFEASRSELLMERRGPVDAPTPDGITLRPGTRGDDRAWMTLHEHGYGARDDFTPLRPQDTEAARRRTGFTLTIAERAGQVVGLCHGVELEPGEGLIESVVVHSCVRGQGIGRALTATALAELADHGVDRVTLNVVADNAPAIAAYRALGFTEYDRLLTYQRAITGSAARGRC
jgi:mycothiol synthase